MAKEKLIVNGYRVPTGASGVAVRKACELILANPGISQKEVLEAAVRFSGLNHSTATWITSPSSKSPVGFLWTRQKEGTFKCYPNEWTHQVVGSLEALRAEMLKDIRKVWGDQLPLEGQLVKIKADYYNPEERLGYLVSGHLTTYTKRHPIPLSALNGDEVFSEGHFGLHAIVIADSRTETHHWMDLSPVS
jgi:hypothetical protein